MPNISHTYLSRVWSLAESWPACEGMWVPKCYTIWHLAILNQWRHVVTPSSYSWQLFLLDLWPWGETEFSSPPQSEQTNEPDALFIIEKAKPRTKAEVRVKTLKHSKCTEREGMLSLPALVILHVNLRPMPNIILVEYKIVAVYSVMWVDEDGSSFALIQESKWLLLTLISGGLAC